MALAALHTFTAGEVLSAANLNALNTNILNNPIALISPFTGSVDAGSFDITALDELAFTDAVANASATGRLRRNAANLTWHDGTAARNLVTNTYTGTVTATGLVTAAGFTGSGNVGIIPAAVSGTPAQHGLFRGNVVKGWVHCNGDGTTVNASFNVTSITDNGTGDLTVTWDRDFSSANYAVVATPVKTLPVLSFQVNVTTMLAGSTRLLISASDGVPTDSALALTIVAIGDQ